MKITSLEDLENIARKGLKKLNPDNKVRISVGFATCGISVGGDDVFKTFKEKIYERKLNNLELCKTGCIGFCGEEPLVNIKMPGKSIVVLHRVTPNDVDDILQKIENETYEFHKAFFKIDDWDHVTSKIHYGDGYENIPKWNEIKFFKPTKRVVLRNSGIINPEDIDEYIAVGGYRSLYKVIKSMTPDEIIEEVKKSGLRGRGGAGFPTGLKWEFAKKEQSDVKYVICNADEGDPGAYMNRNEMESDPHMIIEGMIIGAYATGATEGIIYIRAEYPLAVERFKKAINDAKKYGLLGEKILGSNFNFDIIVTEGAGAFVCGEETALIASVEGEIGRPRLKPPYPAQKGLWGKPTNINNVETWSNVPVIIAKGGDWFSKLGTQKSPGTKVFSLVGKVKNVGLVEVELGTTIDRIVNYIGNDGVNNGKIKAVQTGGPSGGCIPENLFNTPIDYEHLAAVGSIMGSGGIVVMDDDTCMVDTAKYFLDFSIDESCGKCVSCREGLKHMHDILDDITKGKATFEDIDTLKELAQTVKVTSLCGLGKTASNPVLTTLKYFYKEYEEHVKHKRCFARVCKDLIRYVIAKDECTGCTICAKRCPVNAINGEKGKPHIISQNVCVKCGICYDVCKFNSVKKLSEAIGGEK
ncbi:NADH-quinone oxidoreductase subunit NuoF [Deferribacter autotrophicus]|uniref:NADH-quinone oxidoreductase subunit NuoF n=1 Tax=Deferribacter autotrophicus TaxID=500465 RepID=A0A5A8F1U2_9BACT|nr:NADH-quinone oxidoreductase subunit NuoF [Deferribacter autotrophicus]KAA0256846.1 NADH-quinone oxidoreductase subunit NuoF [Deferribacter autotrophicus]